jgi:hypothetical protein
MDRSVSSCFLDAFCLFISSLYNMLFFFETLDVERIMENLVELDDPD